MPVTDGEILSAHLGESYRAERATAERSRRLDEQIADLSRRVAELEAAATRGNR